MRSRPAAQGITVETLLLSSMGQGVTVCARWCCGRVAVQEGIEMVIGTHRCKRRSAGEHAHRRSSASWPRRACGGRGAPRARPTRRGRAYIASSRSRCPRCASPAPQVCARPRSRVPSARRVWRTVGYFPVTRPARGQVWGLSKRRIATAKVGSRWACPRVWRGPLCDSKSHNGLTLRSTFVDQRHPEATAAGLSRSRARAAHHLCL